METVIRSLLVYGLLLVLVRVGGRRTLASMTAFDFVLLLIVGEATQQALLGDDFSVTTFVVVVASLIMTDVAVSELKQRSPLAEKLVDGAPVVLIEDGRRHADRMKKARVDEDDILESARQSHGLERMDQVRYAVLERTGGISVIPYPSQSA